MSSQSQGGGVLWQLVDVCWEELYFGEITLGMDLFVCACAGSTEVGQILRKATAGTGEKLSLELGGKSPMVVFDSADLDSAVEGVIDAVYFNQGQVGGGVIDAVYFN